MKRIVACLMLVLAANGWAADDASHRKALDELMSATQAENIIAGWRKRYEAQAEEVIAASLRGRSEALLNAEQRAAIQRFREQGREALGRGLSWKNMQEPARQAYMSVFTEKEALELAAFYRTPLGQKLLVSLPVVSDGVARAVRAEVDGMRPELQRIGSRFSAEFERLEPKPAAAQPDDLKVRKRSAARACNAFNPKTGCRD